MTNQITVITDSTGTKAWTLNPLGDKRPHVQEDRFFSMPHEFYLWSLNKWAEAESERKCYEVQWEWSAKGMTTKYKPNTLYLAEIVDENTVRILKEGK